MGTPRVSTRSGEILMAHDPSSLPQRPFDAARPADAFPLALWLIWTLAVVATAAWVALPALVGTAQLDTLRLVIRSGMVGIAGLLALTVLEIRLSPWRFLD